MQGTKTEVSPGVWRLRVFVGRRPNGTPIQVRKTVRAPLPNGARARKPGAGSRLADKELAAMVNKATKGQLRQPGSGPTVAQILDDYMEVCELKDRSATTIREYRRIADTVLVPAFGELRAQALTAKHLNRLYGDLKKKGNKPATIRRVHALMGASLAQAKKVGDLERNVALDADPPSVEAAEVSAPTPEQFTRIVKAAKGMDPMFGTFILTAGLTGLRRGELCALRWSDVEWTDNVLFVGRSVYDMAGGGWAEKDTKNHQAVRIPVADQVITALRLHRNSVEALAAKLELEIPDDAFIFSLSPVGSEPIRPDWVTKRALVAGEKASVQPFHLHMLRHLTGTEGFGMGYDVVTVKGAGRWKDASLPMNTYSQPIPERSRQFAQDLADRLLNP
jgi:integrase